MTLGERIKECRCKSHLSQEKVAELVGVSRQAVTKWEAGQSAPNTENLFRLAEIFGTTVDFLISNEDTLARQIYALQQAEETRKAMERIQRRKHNARMTFLAAGCYLAIFITGKLFCLPLEDASVTGWLFGTPPGEPSYLYAWLLSQGLFLYSSLISCLPCIFGRSRFGFTTLAGFAIGLLLGELLGPNPAGAYYGNTHYGWAIWLLIFLESIVMGAILQCFRGKIPLRSKRFLFWCGAFLLGIICTIVCVRLSMYP